MTDSENGKPLEDAIIFLANTPIGSSSGENGQFQLSWVPPGQYSLICSRVGYERRSIAIKVGMGDSLFCEIRLTPWSIPAGEVEVIGKRAEDKRVSTKLFLPDAGENSFCAFGVETTVPIGILFTDSALYMYSLETATIDSEKYVRLWLLIYDKSPVPLEFDGARSVRLGMRSLQKSYQHILPQSPAGDLSSMRDTAAKKIISQTIGATLHVMGQQRSEHVRIALEFDRRATGHPWTGKDPPPEVPGGVNPINLQEIFDRSRNAGILGHYRIFPGEAVNGFVYFPFPGLNWNAATSGFGDASEYRYQIEIDTPTGITQIVFNAR